LFDVYQGKGIDPNRKSVALGLTFQHASRTLTDDEINGFVNQIVAALTKNLDASLRN
jgi:phenylalanyl-tRNA synthetase beta chain